MKRVLLALVLGAAIVAPAAADPAPSNLPSAVERWLVQRGRLQGAVTQVTLYCPTGEAVKLYTADPLVAFGLLSMANGFTGPSAFLSWYSNYDANNPGAVATMVQRINECYLGKPKGS